MRAECKNCKEITTIHSRGLCHLCYSKLYKKSEHTNFNRKRIFRTCRECGAKEKKMRKELCYVCYNRKKILSKTILGETLKVELEEVEKEEAEKFYENEKKRLIDDMCENVDRWLKEVEDEGLDKTHPV